MSQLIQINTGHLLRPQAGDLLVLSTDQHVLHKHAQAICEHMEKHLPGVKTILLSAGLKLAEIHTSKEIARLQAELLAKSNQAPEPFDLDAACQQAMERITASIDDSVRAANGVMAKAVAA